jgi:ParB-like chromosome segregation protein Spo0J
VTERASLVIRYVPLATLVPAIRNAKDHDVPMIRESIELHGVVEAIAVHDGRTGRMIAGHGRVETLRQMQLEKAEPPTGIRRRAKEWDVPVQFGWSSIDDDEAEAVGIVLNRATEAGGWDTRSLAAQLAELAKRPIGLAGTGWSTRELERLTNLLDPVAPIQFPEVDPAGLVIDYICPKCGHEWSGNPKP